MLAPVEELIAVRLTLASGEERFVVTWGRIQDTVDPAPVEQIVLERSTGFSLGSEAVRAEMCATLQEARDQPYFFEALFDFSQRRIPVDGYEAWRSEIDRRMRAGKELYYLGRLP